MTIVVKLRVFFCLLYSWKVSDTFGPSGFTVLLYILVFIFCVITNLHVVCRQRMQHHHKLQCGPHQHLFWSLFLIWSLTLSPQLRRSWSAWTRRGLCCAGIVLACQTWTVTKSLVGSPAAAWQASLSSPAYRRSEQGPHTNTLMQCEGLPETTKRRLHERQGWKCLWGRGWASQRHCALQWRGH